MKWKIYFWVVLVYQIALLGIFLLSDRDILSLGTIVDVISLVGVFGFSHSKRILSQSFWLLIFVINILFFLKGMLYSPYQFYSTFGSIDLMVVVTIWLPFLPLILVPYVLYQYARNSDEIWKQG